MTPARIFLVLCLLFSSPLQADQYGYGTLVVLGISTNKIVIAADSRGLMEGEPPNDHECKIVGLSKRMIFTGAGIEGEEHTVLTQKNWSALAEASRAYGIVQRVSPRSPDLLKSVSDEWLQAMEPRFRGVLKTGRTWLLDRPGNSLFEAVFAGTDESGKFEAREVSITYDRTAEQAGISKPLVAINSWDFTPQIVFKAIGHGEIAYEFAGQSTPRARAEAFRWQGELRDNPAGDLDLRQAVHYVQLTEDLAPVDWGVGGHIDQAEILPHTGLQWIDRKPECH